MDYEDVDPELIVKGDTIGTAAGVNQLPFVVEDINGPQTHGVMQWTFEGHDTATGKLRTTNFRKGGNRVRRYIDTGHA
ncbi:hypothetical protein [Mycolicibacterium komossense]|uniref:Uncharacterized protein n=1 Tax=Mycolicibacterium komossense TaxID=1779 RepID=A0ABT3CGE8_9MYCO|nr:hypothetical protein [Mycolicibacterium komossense]MCV7228576.1 hypothetical protein [Mycolicibacterium komossense]